jgi:phosphotransferase system HPr (HPr) family protein
MLAPSAILVGQAAGSREEAIARVGAVLVGEGLVTVDYIAAMLARETIVSTYLGNGIALPHGTNEAQDAILRTGLAVVQFPSGVAWGDEPARLVIGLAATAGEEHVGILSRLASILEDADTCNRLSRSTDPLEIHRALTSSPDAEPADANGAPPGAITRIVRITNPAGLHARPAAQIVASLQPFQAQITIETPGRRTADARSITALLGLGATVGDDVTLSAHGVDARRVLDAVEAIFTSGSD